MLSKIVPQNERETADYNSAAQNSLSGENRQVQSEIVAPRLFKFSDNVRKFEKRRRGRFFEPSSSTLVVGAGGFGPPKRNATDLQSAPFGHSGMRPFVLSRKLRELELVNGLEPLTC